MSAHNLTLRRHYDGGPAVTIINADLIYAPRMWIAAPGTLAKSDSAGLSAGRDLLDHAQKLLWHCGAQHDRVPAAASEEQTNAPRPRLATRSRRAFRRARGLVSSVQWA